MLKSNEALNRNSEVMREVALATKAENELMAILVGKSQRDSHTIKVLTIIALTYLPASLVAVSLPHVSPPSFLCLQIISMTFLKEIFSSNLIQVRMAEKGSHLVMSHSFWMYPVITCGLMLLTFLPIWLLLPRDEWHRPTLHLAGNNHRAGI